MQINQLNKNSNKNKKLTIDDIEHYREHIEKEFQNYCKVFLYKRGNNYAVLEWDVYYGWGERLFSLLELYFILNSYQKLEKLFPELDLMPFQKIEKGQMH